MPLVTVKVFENEFTTEQKGRIIASVTDAIAATFGEAARPATWVLVEEVKSGDWGVGGRPLTLADVQAAAKA
jgi:4-oxalocrotonate tautomerase